jgi:hypothetical protein
VKSLAAFHMDWPWRIKMSSDKLFPQTNAEV